MQVRVLFQVHDQGADGGGALADDGGHGGSRHLQPGSPQQAEDEDGVQDDVGQGADELGGHGQVGPAGGLEEPLEHDLEDHAEGAAQADPGVGRAVVHDLVDVGLEGEEGVGEEDAQQGEDHEGAQGQEDAHAGGAVGPVLLPGPQGPGDQGVDAHGGAQDDGEHQVLEREGQGDGGEGVLTDPGHEHAVHHVVQGLDQHGDHHGDGHVGQELSHRHDAHFVFGGCGFVCHGQDLFFSL